MDGLSFVIRDKASGFERLVVDHRGAEADLMWNAVSWANFTLDDDHRALGAILTDGARCDVRLNGAEEFRGRISTTPGAGPLGYVQVYVQSDSRKLDDWLGWQLPTATLTTAGATIAASHRRYTGPLETVIKNALRENFTRLGIPWVVATSLGRGPATTIDFRMDKLSDKLYPLLKAARWQLQLTYNGAGVPTLDIRLPNTVAGVLDASSGRLDRYDYSRRAPTATRVVVGGAGEDLARLFALIIDTARETAWEDIIEVFQDATNLKAGDDFTASAAETLADGAPATTVSMEITEQPGFTYRDTYELGDLVNIRVGALTAVEVISKVHVKDDPESGVTITPSVGELARTQVERLGEQMNRLNRLARKHSRR